ncbi:peptidase S55, SpoIVB [Caldicellulosiruptor saccharolyticus DSM 8903]|uniref:Peptidase S55, SpoIVB n=1 Tax=Caldicellulosiruptor saccharolyticus (strain ATCC 43494 / DSM 8903 / Tp8T 6331) TaxID=351627 RepID=A4XKP9_CALS8|nr:peptidase S55, SpoIVB [Caldicellulosiruptor saccharolyticus DSM 8903]
MKKVVFSIFLFYLIATTLFFIYLNITPDYLTCYKSDKCVSIKTPVFVDVNSVNNNVLKTIKNNLLFKTSTFYLNNKSNSLICELRIGTIPLKVLKISIIEQKDLIVMGRFVGIKLMTNGILVIGYSYVYSENSKPKIPAREAGVQIGDQIISANGQKLIDCDQLFKIINSSQGKTVTLLVKRGEYYKEVKIKPILSSEGVYKIGLWVRDGTSGIGTLTFVDKKRGTFGALGHGISDIDTNILLDLKEGQVYKAEVIDIKKNEYQGIGEVIGNIDESAVVGNILINSQFGVYGKLIDKDFLRYGVNYEVARAQDVRVGDGYIITDVSNSIQKFKVKIEKILPLYRNSTKAMVVKVTDKRLMKITGGIVQGMSGSPIIQDNKLVGAVTHVFMKEPDKGYAVFIENMINMTNRIR